jgi:hypothetical protein
MKVAYITLNRKEALEEADKLLKFYKGYLVPNNYKYQINSALTKLKIREYIQLTEEEYMHLVCYVDNLCNVDLESLLNRLEEFKINNTEDWVTQNKYTVL